MKKFLLSMSAAVACMSMSAAVPALQDQFNGSFNVTQENPNYSNPSAYDANGNLIITGAFNDVFGNLEAIGTSAYIVKYDKSNAQQWSVALTGSATITAIDTDAAGNIYVAGTLADIVEFGSADGHSTEVGGLMLNGEFTTGQNASFLVKYSAAGEVLAIRTFVPQALPELSSTGMYYPTDGDILFTVNSIKVDGDRVYASASYRGQTEIDGVYFNGTYADPWGGAFFIDYKNAGVFSLDCYSLRYCKSEVSFECVGPFLSDEVVELYSISFTVNNGKVSAGITVVGNAGNEIKVVDETNGYDVTRVGFDRVCNKFIFTTTDRGTTVLNHESPKLNGHLENVAGMYIDNDKIYAVCTAMETIPSEGMGMNSTVGMSDVFVVEFNNGSSAPKIYENRNYEGYSEITNAEDVPEIKLNYELAKSAKLVGNTLYINTTVYNANSKFIKLASYWFDGAAFSAAPVAATGVAVGDGVVALVSSDATKVDYKTYTFTPTQSGISGIEADFDENAPVEYFNLQGIRVANPENGLYIRRQGNKVEKVIL